VIAVLQGRGQAAGTAVVAAQAGVPQLAASSLKAALDADWDDPAARDYALAEVLGLLDRVDAFIDGQAGGGGRPAGTRPGHRSDRAGAGAPPRSRQRPADQHRGRRNAARAQVPSTSSPASPSPTVISSLPDGYMTGALDVLAAAGSSAGT